MLKIHQTLTNNASSADNQQEILNHQYYYFTGFCCGEISFSVIRDKSKSGSGVRYYPDITFSNSDIELLKNVNLLVGNNQGLFSRIKGGFNLSFRGKRKVKIILDFFKLYPPVIGDLVLTRINLIKRAIEILESKNGRSRSQFHTTEIEKIRLYLKQIKSEGKHVFSHQQTNYDQDVIGHFIAGIMDAEGSVGIKKSGSFYGQPFIALAMKDKKIVELVQQFFNLGKVRYRPKDKTYHWEVGARKNVRDILQIFCFQYPFKLPKMIERVKKVQKILNDYTPGSVKSGDDIV